MKTQKSKLHNKYTTKDGMIVPGVSTIIGELDKSNWMVPWAVRLTKEGVDYRTYRDGLADVGTLTHDFILCGFKGIKSSIIDEYSKVQIEAAKSCYRKFLNWTKEHKIEPIRIEEKFVSEIFKVGGRLDLYGRLDGYLSVLDFKTGKGIYDSSEDQVVAYRQLVIEDGDEVEQIGVINIPRSEGESFAEWLCRDKTYMDICWRRFKGALDAYYARRDKAIYKRTLGRL